MKIKPFSILIIISIAALFTSCNRKIAAEKAAAMKTASTLTPETQHLLTNLMILPQKGFMFGHHDDPLYGVGWSGDSDRSDVKSVVGDYPAVMSFDLGRIELTQADNLDKTTFAKIRQEIINQYNRGGMISISWHINNPLTDGDAWDVKTPGAVTSIIPGGKNHRKFMQWLQNGANFLNTLKTADGTKIPIIFRPWHEHTGSWFWWGKGNCTAAEYKQLWIMTHDFMKNQGLNNLLFAYSPDIQGPGEIYMEFYPGDEYVDLLGVDAYHRDNEKGTEAYTRSLSTHLAFMTEEGKKRHKPIAITETGLEAIPIADWWTKVLLPIVEKYPVSYVLVWRNAYDRENHYYAPYPGQKSAADFLKFYENSKTLFSKDVDDLYK